MNCRECREEFAACLERSLDDTRQTEIDSHLAGCPACRTELDEVRQLTVRLARQRVAIPSVSLEIAVMDRIFHEQALEIRRLKMRKRLQMLGISGAMAAATAVLLVGSFWFAQPAAAEKTAAQVLAQGAEAMPRPSTVHIVTKMRTPPNDNFGTIVPECEPVAVEVWRQFGDKPKWRMEEPGRVMVMDGTGTVCLVRPNIAWKSPLANDKNWGPALELTKTRDMISRELSTALAKGWDLKLSHETTAAGEKKLVVTVETKSGLPDDDYLKNKDLVTADARRV